MLQVIPIPGEPTRYHCESNSLECTNTQCGLINRKGEMTRTLFNRKLNAELHPGRNCPKCKTGTLDVRFHLVSVADYNGIGSCSCEYFQIRLRKELTLLLPKRREELAEQGNCKLRCAHIERVRNYCLNLTIKAHEREQGVEKENAA